MGVHREAEFNKRHVPGYLRGEHARGWLCLYPFVRSYEWYLLPEEERSACSPSTAARVRASGGRRQHRLDLRSQRLRVAAAAGERRPHPPRRHDARPARDGRPSPRARGGAVLHGPALELDELAEVLELMAENIGAVDALPRFRPKPPRASAPPCATAPTVAASARRDRRRREPHVSAPTAYDGVLLLGFGGPEGQDDVIPFLRNVTAGRGIPDERLEEVAHHYRHFGGVSPINSTTAS
jgi:hypothetical protein